MHDQNARTTHDQIERIHTLALEMAKSKAQGDPLILRLVADAIVEHLNWPSLNWNFAQLNHNDDDPNRRWFMVRPRGDGVECRVDFRCGGTTVAMTLSAAHTVDRHYKVVIFGKMNESIDLYELDTLPAIAERAAKEIRYLFLEAARSR